MGNIDKSYLVKFGENLKKIRNEKGLSQHQLATKCEVDRSKISQIENGKEEFYFSTFIEISRGLGVDPKILLDF